MSRIKFEVSVELDGPVPAGLAEKVSAILSDWNDGRKPYAVELIEDGLRQVLRAALVAAVEAEQRAIYGNEMVPVPSMVAEVGFGSSQSSKAGLEAARLLRRRKTFLSGDIKCTSVEWTQEDL